MPIKITPFNSYVWAGTLFVSSGTTNVTQNKINFNENTYTSSLLTYFSLHYLQYSILAKKQFNKKNLIVWPKFCALKYSIIYINLTFTLKFVTKMVFQHELLDIYLL